MTTFLLIRHAHCDPIGRSIAGRAPGVHLNAQGRAAATALGERLSSIAIKAVYSSPLERARETATPMALRLGLEVENAPGLLEVDFGHWTGRTLAELHGIPEWKAFNSFRSGTRIPGGENMAEVLARALQEIERIQRAHSASTDLVAVVSHGDVLRVLIAHYLGIPVDLFQRLEVSPASVSVLSLEPYGPRVLRLNSTEEWPT
jgi:probable phosphomutase (TIGR03848 family)